MLQGLISNNYQTFKTREMSNTITIDEYKRLNKAGKLKGKKKNHRESELQQACVRWFRLQYPELYMNLFAIPNGGWRPGIESSIMTGEGVLPGVADLFLAKPHYFGSGVYSGLFIEMKVNTNKQSEAQKLFQIAVENAGYSYWVIKTFDDFVTVIDYYLK